MEEEEDIPPFWLQPTERRRLSRRASSVFLNSGVLLLFLLVIAFVFVFIVVPAFVSFTSQIFSPHLIKKSWDSLNLVLVLFAVVCGFLGRNHGGNNNGESPSYRNVAQRSYPSTPLNRWNQDRTAYGGLNRLRSFNSYPDLRQESLWMSNEERWRFYDDTYLNGYRMSSNSDQVADVVPPPEKRQLEVRSGGERRRFYDDTYVSGYRVGWNSDQVQDVAPPPAAAEPKQEVKEIEQEEVSVKDVKVDDSVKEVVSAPSPPPSPPPPAESPPPPRRSASKPPAKAVRRKVKRTYEDVGSEKRKVEKEFEVNNFHAPPVSPPHPSPQPAPVVHKSEKKRGKDLLTSFRKKKKKNQRQKSVENLESLFDPQSSFYQSSIPPPSPAPPPPPPPPPPHFFQNLFSTKKSRAKKAHSAPPPPPPPPRQPPPSSRPTRVPESQSSRANVQVAAAVATQKPPKSVRSSAISAAEMNVEIGNLSPLHPIPPPPPLPPFKLSSWKFVRDGDFVRVASFNSSRSASPDLDGDEQSEKESSPMAETKDESKSMPLFCPSPDVNTKAENFIARFRAGLKMEKMNSVKGRSNLGPGPESEGPT